MNNRPLILSVWTPNFYFQKDFLRVLPLWITYPKLPLYCWGPECLSRTASCVGKPFFADECTAKQLRVSFARVIVEVDITQDSPNSVLVQDPSGSSFEQQITFEWKPVFCKKCLKIGHNCEQHQVVHEVPPRDRRNRKRRRQDQVWRHRQNDQYLQQGDEQVQSVNNVPVDPGLQENTGSANWETQEEFHPPEQPVIRRHRRQYNLQSNMYCRRHKRHYHLQNNLWCRLTQQWRK